MNYRIEELGSFSIIGQEIELTNFRAQNIQISTVFWKRFNINLKKSYLSHSRQRVFRLHSGGTINARKAYIE